MEYVYAALLLHSAGQKVTADAVKAILTAASAKVDDAKVSALVAALDGVNIEEAIKNAAIPVAAAPAAAAPAGGDGKKEEKKKEEDEGKNEAQAAAGLANLFG